MSINVKLILHFYDYQKFQVNYKIACKNHNQLSIFKSIVCEHYNEVIYVYKT